MEDKVTNYIPHRGRMVLIDRIISKLKDKFLVEVNITNSSLLATQRGVPSYCIVEYMAQSIAAYNSLHFHEGKSIKIGFMVSIRNLKNQFDFFPLNVKIVIRVSPVLIVENSGTFNCIAYINEKEVSSARITAYVPTNEELEIFKQNEREFR